MFKTRVGVLLFVILILLAGYYVLFTSACSLDFLQTSTQTQNSPTGPSGVTPTATPTPGVPANPVTVVSITEIGRETCPLVIEPNQLPPTPCKAVLTCTPRDKDGKDVGLGYVPTWDVAGPGGITPTSINPYNARAECDGPNGSILITCAVGEKLGVKGYACRG